MSTLKYGYAGPFTMIYFNEDEEKSYIYDMDTHGEMFASDEGYPLYVDIPNQDIRVAVVFYKEGSEIFVKESYPFNKSKMIKNTRIQ